MMAFLLSLALAVPSKASPAPVIRMVPKDNAAEPDTTFTLNVTVVGIEATRSLFGWEVKIKFDPNILNAVGGADGPFLNTSGHPTYWLPPEIDNTEGTIILGALLTPPFPSQGAVGSGTLATVTFKAVSRGSTALDFEDTEMYTVISKNNVPIMHTHEDGSFSNAAGFMPSLELVGVVVAVVAVGGVGLFLYMRRRKS